MEISGQKPLAAEGLAEPQLAVLDDAGGRRSRKFAAAWTCAVAALLLGAGLLVNIGMLRDAVNPYDEGILLTYTDRTMHGFVQQKDFFSLYGPGNYWVLAKVFAAFGTSLTTERFVGAAYRLLLMLGLFMVGLKRGRSTAVCGAVLGFLTAASGGALAGAWVGAMAMCVWSLWLLHLGVVRERKCWTAVFLSGCLAGFATSMRVDTPAVGIMLAAALVLWIGGWRAICWYILGWVIGLAPLLLHLNRVGIRTFIDNSFIEPLVRFGTGRRLPIPPIDPSETLCMLGVLAPIVALATIAAVRLWRNRSPENWYWTASAIFLIALSPQAFNRADVSHFMCVAEVTWGTLPITIALALEGRAQNPASSWRRPLLASSLALNLALCTGGWLALVTAQNALWHATGLVRSDSFLVTNRDRSVPVASADYKELLMSVLQTVESVTKPGDRVFIGPRDLRTANANDVFLYYLLPQLTPAGYYWEMNPGGSNREGSPLAKDIGTAKVLILNLAWDQQLNVGKKPDLGPDEPNNVVRDEFELKTQIERFFIYVHK